MRLNCERPVTHSFWLWGSPPEPQSFVEAAIIVQESRVGVCLHSPLSQKSQSASEDFIICAACGALYWEPGACSREEKKGGSPVPGQTDRHHHVHTADQQNVETMGDIKEEFIDPGGRLGTLGLNHREQEMKAARITGRGCNRRQIKPSVAFLLTVTSKSLQILSHSLDTSWLFLIIRNQQ